MIYRIGELMPDPESTQHFAHVLSCINDKLSPPKTFQNKNQVKPIGVHGRWLLAIETNSGVLYTLLELPLRSRLPEGR